MKFREICLIVLFMAIAANRITAGAQEADPSILRQLAANTSFSGQWFLIYQVHETGGEYFNEFTLRRGYITFSKKFNDIFSVRFTQDITLDEEGTDAGNIEMRLKYCLVHIDNSFMPVLRNSWWEVGLINRPLYSFEDKVNDYRVQGSMFLDKYKVLSSADFGISFTGLIGGEVNEEFQKNVSSSFPGLFGSYSFGVYNGGGYHAIEVNTNKTIEGRVTIRPLGNTLAGLQLSYNFLRGKGNTEAMPDFHFNQLYLTWQSKPLIFAGQIYSGRGNGAGTFTAESGIPYYNKGYSLFGELKFLPSKFALISRFDHHNISADIPTECTSVIAGIAYRFAGNNKILINTDIRNKNEIITRIYEAALEIRF
ncbi:MAG: hypothetical protein IH591_03740 [Bacteroidales bacterium]|nr:hypothetical protein [Bacteroidales bacterium]